MVVEVVLALVPVLGRRQLGLEQARRSRVPLQALVLRLGPELRLGLGLALVLA